MPFVQNLQQAGNSPSGIFNPGGGESTGQMYSDALSLHNQIKNKELEDFKDKANFMADLQIKQDRLRRIYGLDDSSGAANWQQQQGGMNVAAPGISPYQQGELGIRQQELGLKKQELAQKGQLGEEGLQIRTAQERLNQQKSDQIHEQKQAELEQKVNESNNRLKIAEDKIKQAGDDLDKKLNAQKEMRDAVEERHKLELAQKDFQFRRLQDQHDAALKSLDNYRKAQGNKKTVTEIDETGRKKTVTTQAGDNAETVTVTGKDGNQYTIPKSKLDDWNKNHAPNDQNPDQEEEEE